MIQRFQRAALALALVATPGTAAGQGFETPPSFSAAGIPGIKARGPNYTVKDPVRSDGLMRAYALETPYGNMAVQGDQMLRMRLNELTALAELEKITGSESFSKAMVEAGVSPLKYTGRFIMNPVQTFGDTLGGIGNFFGRIGSGIANAGRTQDNALAGLLGVTDQKRQLAARFGVDPYTDFEPLNVKLTQLSEAAALGGLAVTGAMFAIPGAAGIVVSNLKTANTLSGISIENLARDYTAAQILDINRQRLIAMGVEGATIEALLTNRNYTPVDMAATVAALDGMGGVADRGVFLERVAAANSRSIAYFMRRQAELIAAHQSRTKALTRFVSLGGFPFAQTRDRGVVAVIPADALSWTQTTARAFQDSAADMRKLGASRAEIRITGRATALAKRRLKEMGWTVVENVRS